jgi:hypothetical protein
LLNRTTLDDRLAASLGGGEAGRRPENIRVEHWISTAVFWLIMLFTLVLFFQRLNLPAISTPLGGFLDQIIDFIPGLIGAAILLLLAWIIATVLRTIVVRLINASGVTRRLAENVDVRPQDRIGVSQTIGNVVYWLVFLLFLPAILDALKLQGLLAPVQGLLNEILTYLPNVLGAAVILIIGWLVAKVVRQIVTNLLAGVGVDNFGQRAGIAGALGNLQLSNLIGTILYVLILIPVIIAALNALAIPAVSEPAANMLNSLLLALPAIFGGLLLLGIAFFLARLVGTFVAGILANIGFNSLFAWLGLYRMPGGAAAAAAARPTSSDVIEAGRAAGETAARGAGPSDVDAGRMTPASIAGYLVTIAIMLFAVMEAANMMGFENLAALVARFIAASTQIIFGLVIFGLGLFLANLAERVIRDSGVSQSNILATAARWAILIFSVALALREMGIAESIVNLAFGLLLGAVAVAVALAFGLGGRDVAARQLERWRQDVQGGLPSPGRPGLPPTPSGPVMDPQEGPDKG